VGRAEQLPLTGTGLFPSAHEPITASPHLDLPKDWFDRAPARFVQAPASFRQECPIHSLSSGQTLGDPPSRRGLLALRLPLLPVLVGLTLNAEKTKEVDLWQEAVAFLGFEILMQRSPRTGRAFPMVQPSKKALAGIRQAIKERTPRQQACHPPAMVIADLNRQVRGWV